MFITPIFETLFFFFSCIAVGPTVVGYWGHAVLAHVDRVFFCWHLGFWVWGGYNPTC